MLNALVLFVLLGLLAFPAAVTAWALIEAERTGALDTGECEGCDGPARGGRQEP